MRMTMCDDDREKVAASVTERRAVVSCRVSGVLYEWCLLCWVENERECEEPVVCCSSVVPCVAVHRSYGRCVSSAVSAGCHHTVPLAF